MCLIYYKIAMILYIHEYLSRWTHSIMHTNHAEKIVYRWSATFMEKFSPITLLYTTKIVNEAHAFY